MTIKEFAKLCDCNPKTLRYYDGIDLLKPVNVDPWTGYRYYDEDQAVAFVKIKNLQKAGFSIDEIKELITKDDLAVAMAFESKIAEAEAHLREIKKIRQSYLTEMINIQEKILECKNSILNSIKNYDPTEEFGISKEQYAGICRDIESMMDEAANSMPDAMQTVQTALQAFSEMPETTVEAQDFRKDASYGVIYEKHGWKNVRDFLADFENLESGTYGLDFILTEEKLKDSVAFCNTMPNILLAKNEGRDLTLNCETAASSDGLNHFRLFKKTVG